MVAGRRDDVVGSYAQTDLLPGSPVVPDMFGEEPSLPPGASRIGLSLAAGRYPPSLTIGDNITIVVLDPNGDSNDAQGTAVGCGARRAERGHRAGRDRRRRRVRRSATRS